MESFGISEAQFGGASENSFTALLELSPGQAVELLHSAGGGGGDVRNRHRIIPHQAPYAHTLNCSLPFPSNAALIERAAKYSVFATGEDRALKMKSEPAESNSNPNLSEKAAKRKDREEKGKGLVKKRKTSGDDESGDGEKIQYVHVRARRGEATDSHSLAERARREKINARMKLLQELVPGCTKISGTALVLDQIINHVQNLQRQVEYLSMKLAEANPRTDFNLDSLFAAGNRSLMGSNFHSMMMPITWPEIQMNGDGQQGQEQWPLESVTQPDWAGEENQCNLISPEISLLSYDSSGNSVSLHPSNQQTEQGNAS